MSEPHVGHLFTLVLADIFKRWQVLLGKTDAKLLTGTDEHGMKVCRDVTVDNAGLDIVLTMGLPLYRSSKRPLRKTSLLLRYAIRMSKRFKYGIRMDELRRNELEDIRN